MDLFSNIDENEGLGFVPNNEPDLSRGKNNELSKEAWSKVDAKGSRAEVLALIDGNKCTIEIAFELGKQIHKISGRFTELKASDQIVKIGKKEINGGWYSVYQKK